MYQEDFYNPVDQNDYDETQLDMLEKTKREDRGYNVIYRKVVRKDGSVRNKKIEVYTSSGTGSRIRDAETGEYYPNVVGSKDEELYFKVVLATGECTSANKSNTLFYFSPQHYANHLRCDVDPLLVHNWEKRRDRRLAELNSDKNENKTSDVNVSRQVSSSSFATSSRSYASVVKNSV